MPTNILMPALSPTMEKGNLARWLKKEGDKIKSGDVIAEIETDKATMEYEAVDDGTLAKIVVPEGTQDVAVNSVIAVLASEGEDVKAAARAPKMRYQRAAQKSAGSLLSPTSAPKADATVPASPVPPSPASTRIAQPGCAGSRGQSDLLVSARAAARERSGPRSQRCARFGATWPRNCPRYRRRKIRKGFAWAGRSTSIRGRCTINCSLDVGPADPITVRRRQL